MFVLQQGNRSLTVGSKKASKGNAAERLRGVFFSFFHIRYLYPHPLPCPFFCSVQTQWILGWRSNEGTSSGCCFMTKSVPGSPTQASDTPGPPLQARPVSCSTGHTRVPPASKTKPPSPAPCRQTPNSSRRNIRISVPRLHLQRPSIAAIASLLPLPSPSPASSRSDCIDCSSSSSSSSTPAHHAPLFPPAAKQWHASQLLNSACDYW